MIRARYNEARKVRKPRESDGDSGGFEFLGGVFPIGCELMPDHCPRNHFSEIITRELTLVEVSQARLPGFMVFIWLFPSRSLLQEAQPVFSESLPALLYLKNEWDPQHPLGSS